MNKAVVSVITAFVAGIAGSILTFVPPQVIRSWGLDFGMHDDRVLIGVFALVICVVAVYKLLLILFGKPEKAFAAPARHAKKPKKRKR
ncbi:hypothetical protein HY493_03760 [Candidatus Woesearchaeota archaeon]|nr:hypothetical protein [Candidatus Woesearchaeota archaeon]